MNTYYEEKNLGKIYDRKLMKRLLHYIKPYKKYVIFAFIALLLIACIEISLPLISKYVIDEYISPSYKIINLENEMKMSEEFTQLYKKYITDQDGHKFLMKSIHLNKLSAKDLQYIKKNHLVSNDVYIKFTNQEVSVELRNKYSELFSDFGNYVIIKKLDLKQISLSDTRLLRAKDINGIVKFAIIFFLILIIRFVVSYVQIYLIQYAGQHSMYDLRMKLFNHLQRLPFSFFDKNPIGRLVTRVTNDIQALDEMLSTGLITLIQDVILMIAIIIIMLIVNIKLALVTFIVLPILTVMIVKFRSVARNIYRLVRVKLARINATLSEDISGMSIIQMFNHKKASFKHFSKINEEYYQATLKQLKVFAIFRPLIDLIYSLALALVIWYGGGRILADQLSLGALVAFIEYVRRFFEPIHDFSEKFNILQSAMASSERIFDLMDTQPEYMINTKKLPIKSETRLKGEIKFKNIWFAYNENEYVLKDVSFKISPGENIAIVGATGAGKSSIISLISNFYTIQKGEILLDGIPHIEFDMQFLRRNIGIVQQDVFLFSGDIYSNISLGNDKITNEKIIESAKYVNAHKFITKLSGNYNHEVKEHGSTLSAGQRQLIAFARVLAYDPAIFILDEATSNIDTETELLIQEALKKVMKGRTSIVIAHRLSTIKYVDRIIVLHKGRIVEQGTHQDLLKNGGIYYDLYCLQYEPQIASL